MLKLLVARMIFVILIPVMSCNADFSVVDGEGTTGTLGDTDNTGSDTDDTGDTGKDTETSVGTSGDTGTDVDTTEDTGGGTTGNDTNGDTDDETTPVDADSDGWFTPFDCNDTDSSILPEGEEIANNGVDDDCDGETDEEDGGTDTGLNCLTPPNKAGPDVELAAEFQPYYTVYDLGQIDGIPNPLGGITVKFGDPNTLLVAGNSEKPGGAIYEVTVDRGPCGHILGFASGGVLVAETPYVDANLEYYPGGDLLFYSEWPRYTLSQLPYGAAAPLVQTNLLDFGMPSGGDQGPGGVGFVPPGIPDAAGELRIVTWPGGRWYHVDLQPNGALFDVVSITETTQLSNEPGGLAYVPAGSPGFEGEAVIVAEWRESKPNLDRVAVYDVDDAGDPIVSTRRELLTKFPRPWGAYFEPVTGDYLFLSWGTGADRVYLIQGFAPPPEVY